MNEQQNKVTLLSNPITQSIIGIVLVFVALGGFIFWQNTHGTIFIENAQINAPIINLSGISAGTLNALYVKEGDIVDANTPVALIGTNVVATKVNGKIISVAKNIGAYFVPGTAVVSMIHPDDMNVVGAIDETKGLEKIKVGQKATFTVDAFGGKTYVGVVDSVGETADSTGVVFSISDKRPVRQFDVKVRFDVTKYPELKNGMSAKITVYTK